MILGPTIRRVAPGAASAYKGTDGRSFYPQLVGQSAQPREWLYSWYSSSGGATPQWEYTMTVNHKLYRDGRFFDLAADPFEAKPIDRATLTGAPVEAPKKLQVALDQFTNARPEALAAPGHGPGKGKKKAGKEKKEDDL